MSGSALRHPGRGAASLSRIPCGQSIKCPPANVDGRDFNGHAAMISSRALPPRSRELIVPRTDSQRAIRRRPPGAALRRVLVLMALSLAAQAQDDGSAATGELEQFGEWATRCYEQPADKPTCVAFQNAVLTDSGARIVYVETGYPPGQQRPVLFVSAPLGLYLPAGVEAVIDDTQRQPITMLHCDQNGCHGASIIDEVVLAAMQDGEELVIHFRNNAGRVFRVPLSLDGFADAYEAATSQAEPSPPAGNDNP